MAAAYALLKLHRFGPRLTMILFAVSIAVDFFFIWSAGGAIPTMQQSAGILFKIAVITFLLSAGVQELYRLHKLERRNA
jgi:hypothetical protein